MPVLPALPADEPLRHFLGDLRALYPAFPTLLHTLLAALSSTADSGAPPPPAHPPTRLPAVCPSGFLGPGLHSIYFRCCICSVTQLQRCHTHPPPCATSRARTAAAAASANAYLAQLSSLVCLHVLPDTGIEEDPNEEGIVYAQQPIPLPGARMLTLPQVRRHARWCVWCQPASQAGSLIPLLQAALQVLAEHQELPGTSSPCQQHESHDCVPCAGWLQGTLGEVIPLPEGLASADSLWTVAAGEDIEHVQLVRWRFALPDGVGQWILLCRVAGEGWAGWAGCWGTTALCLLLALHAAMLLSCCWYLPASMAAPWKCCNCTQRSPPASNVRPAEALAFIQHQPAGAPPGTARIAAALAELAASLQLLAAFCTCDPHTGLELLHVELPAGGSPEAGQRGPDLLSLACQTVAVLAQLPEPPTAIIGGWPLVCLPVCSVVSGCRLCAGLCTQASSCGL